MDHLYSTPARAAITDFISTVLGIHPLNITDLITLSKILKTQLFYC